MPALPHDYAERVYAGILGKIIGVYLGRPFEQWSHEAIVERFGEIRYFVNAQMDMPLVLTDDDITGTFTFLRALPDHGNDAAITPAQIGRTWLNYIIENRSILWWGGLGNSTEHTAFLRLKSGISAPESGSAGLNTRAVAEEIGAQIFIDGWAMVAPGDPARAADLARRAASVSHDGEAIHGAQVIAAMESLAFVEPDLNRLLDAALALIPRDCQIRALADQLRDRRRRESDWRETLAWIRREWGYERYGTNCPMLSNHAIVLLGLLYGDDDFQRSMLVTNTAGYDTDCNAGNVGCLLGIKNGLGAFSAPGQPDWRGPVADRLYLPTADGGRGVTDAVRETLHVVNTGRALAGLPPERPKDGAAFHFSLPGSVQGWMPDPASPGLTVSNAAGRLRLGFAAGAGGRAESATFAPPEALHMAGYALTASPVLYPGQTVRARIAACAANRHPVEVGLSLRHYVRLVDTTVISGPRRTLDPGEAADLCWRVPDTAGNPICHVGVDVGPSAADGAVELDRLGWSGAPQVRFFDTGHRGIWWKNENRPAWQLQWVNALDHAYFGYLADFHLIQNHGRGLLATGSADWTDYRVSARITPRLLAAGGLAVRYQGLERHYALEFVAGGEIRLVRRGDGERELWRGPLEGPWETARELTLAARGPEIAASVDGRVLATVVDSDRPLLHGGIAFVVTDGRLTSGPVSVDPLPASAP